MKKSDATSKERVVEMLADYGYLTDYEQRWVQKGEQAGLQKGMQAGMQAGMQELLKFLEKGHSIEEAKTKFLCGETV